MKNSPLVSIILSLSVLILIISMSGCSDSITNSTTTIDKYKARTEAEFSSVIGDTIWPPPGAVVYVDLEHLNAPASGVNGDTGPIGEDVIPYKYTETATHRIKLGVDAKFKARLENSSGAVIYRLNNPGDTARVSIPAGNYKLYLTSTVNYGTGTGASQPVFIQRDMDAINSGAGAPPQGGYNKDDLNTLLTTGKCVGCNLESIQLNNKDLTGADLTRAKMAHAFMDRVNLTGATFNNTEWTDGAANNCNFAGSKFINTFLYRTGFDHGFFQNAIFQHILWDRTYFGTCDFRNAILDSGSGYNGSMDNSNFNNARISNLSWHEISAEATSFVSATFSKVECFTMYFPNTVMDSAKFINNCFFQRAQLRNSKVRYAEFTDFRGDGSLYTDCDMRGTKITNGYFAGGSFRASILINNIWNNVNVMAVNMCHQDRTGAVMNNIQYNVDTDCWP